MKPALILLCIFVAIFGVSSTPGGRRNRPPNCPRPTAGRVGICAFTCTVGQCGQGRECCPTGCRGTACVRIPRNTGVPRWCPRGSPRIRCFVNPCTVMTCPAVPRARCVNDNPCERACSGNFYVGPFLVSYSMCHSR